MDKKIIEQTFVSKKTDEGYYLEIFNDGKLAFTDTFHREDDLNEFIKTCNEHHKWGSPYLSQDEARKMLENNEYSVDFFYRHPLGYRFASICHIDLMPEYNETGYTVFYVNKNDFLDEINVPTMEEAFDIIKKVENGIM